MARKGKPRGPRAKTVKQIKAEQRAAKAALAAKAAQKALRAAKRALKDAQAKATKAVVKAKKATKAAKAKPWAWVARPKQPEPPPKPAKPPKAPKPKKPRKLKPHEPTGVYRPEGTPEPVREHPRAPKDIPQIEIPSGLIPTVAELMYAKIKQALATTKVKLHEYDTTARIHISDDFLIDAEFSIMVPRGVLAQDVLTDLNEAFRPFPIYVEYTLDDVTYRSPPTWVSTGVKVPLRPEEYYSGRYAIHNRGLTHAGSYYRRGFSFNYAFITGRKIIRNFDAKGRRKPESVFCRIHWNPFDTKPTREG